MSLSSRVTSLKIGAGRIFSTRGSIHCKMRRIARASFALRHSIEKDDTNQHTQQMMEQIQSLCVEMSSFFDGAVQVRSCVPISRADTAVACIGLHRTCQMYSNHAMGLLCGCGAGLDGRIGSMISTNSCKAGMHLSFLYRQETWPSWKSRLLIHGTHRMYVPQ